MISIPLAQAKNQLSELIGRVERGDAEGEPEPARVQRLWPLWLGLAGYKSKYVCLYVLFFGGGGRAIR